MEAACTPEVEPIVALSSRSPEGLARRMKYAYGKGLDMGVEVVPSDQCIVPLTSPVNSRSLAEDHRRSLTWLKLPPPERRNHCSLPCGSMFKRYKPLSTVPG